jgi:hypothetical protein
VGVRLLGICWESLRMRSSVSKAFVIVSSAPSKSS